LEGQAAGGGRPEVEYKSPCITFQNNHRSGLVQGSSAISGESAVLLKITAENLRNLLKTALRILTAVFEALLQQQFMHNFLRMKA
jgi:hypothetical protein